MSIESKIDKIEKTAVDVVNSLNDGILSQKDYFCVTAYDNNVQIALNKQGTPYYNIYLEYSLDKVTWTPFVTNGTVSTLPIINMGQRMWFRGDNVRFSNSTDNRWHFTFSSYVELSGKLVSLIDSTCNTELLYNSGSFQQYQGCFCGLFANAQIDNNLTNVWKVDKLVLPTPTVNAFQNMLAGGRFKNPPLIPTDISAGCYTGMFYNCGSLREAPVLVQEPQGTSYSYMFYGCTNLKRIKVHFTSWGDTTNFTAPYNSTYVLECPSNLAYSSVNAQYWTYKRYGMQPPVPNDCLCFKALENNSTIGINKNNTSAPTINLQYTVNNGIYWLDYTWNGTTGATITLQKNQCVFFKGTNQYINNSYANYNYFVMTGSFEASGSIMSLTGSSEMYTSYAFTYLFLNCASLKTAPKLPARYLPQSCYAGMFSGCTSLEVAPELPATALGIDCYDGMFRNCTSLKVAPPKLPADVKNACYYGMFNNCTSLEVAPELPATILDNNVYGTMFAGCTSLKYLKVGFADWGTNTCSNWLNGASTTGTFVCPAGLDTTTTQDASHVPSTWTVIHGSNYPDAGSTTVVDASTSETYIVCPSAEQTPVVTVSSALT